MITFLAKATFAMKKKSWVSSVSLNFSLIYNRYCYRHGNQWNERCWLSIHYPVPMSVILFLTPSSDDCWAGPRDNNGDLTADPTRFPSGMKTLADFVHSKGLLFGLYTCAGNLTCKFNRPGSWGHFDQDANTFASWGIDYVKMVFTSDNSKY